MQTQAHRAEVLRILDTLAQGGYLDRTARSVSVWMGAYSPSKRVFGLAKLRFEALPSSAHGLRASLQAVAAPAPPGTVAAWSEALLHLAWFALAATTLAVSLGSTSICCGRMLPLPRPLMWQRAGLLPPPALRVLELLLGAAQVAAAWAYVAVLVAAARLPSAGGVAGAAFHRLYEDVTADARILLPAKEEPAEGLGWSAGAGSMHAAGVTGGEAEEIPCGVVLPTQLWTMPVWALPDSTHGWHAFGQSLVCSLLLESLHWFLWYTTHPCCMSHAAVCMLSAMTSSKLHDWARLKSREAPYTPSACMSSVVHNSTVIHLKGRAPQTHHHCM